MNKILLAASALLFSSISWGQFALSQSTLDLEIGEALDYQEITLTNNGTDSAEMAVALDVRCYDEMDGMQLQVCLGEVCFDFVNVDTLLGVVNAVPVLHLAPGESSGFISLHQFFGNVYGSEWLLTFFDRDNPDDSVDLEVYVDVCDQANAIEAYSSSPLELGRAYPSPANARVKIPYTTGLSEARLVLTDLLGHQVKQVALEEKSGEIALDMSEVPNGVYFYSIVGDGMRSAVRSLVISH